jgi:hypothetical protein
MRRLGRRMTVVGTIFAAWGLSACGGGKPERPDVDTDPMCALSLGALCSPGAPAPNCCRGPYGHVAMCEGGRCCVGKYESCVNDGDCCNSRRCSIYGGCSSECANTLYCLNSCLYNGGASQTCYDGCVSDSGPTGRQLADAFSQCAGTGCFGRLSTDFSTCAHNQCPAEWTACIAG